MEGEFSDRGRRERLPYTGMAVRVGNMTCDEDSAQSERSWAAERRCPVERVAPLVSTLGV